MRRKKQKKINFTSIFFIFNRIVEILLQVFFALCDDLFAKLTERINFVPTFDANVRIAHLQRTRLTLMWLSIDDSIDTWLTSSWKYCFSVLITFNSNAVFSNKLMYCTTCVKHKRQRSSSLFTFIVVVFLFWKFFDFLTCNWEFNQNFIHRLFT